MGELKPQADRRDPLREGALGFAWMFTTAFLVCGSGAVVAIALGTHLVLRLRPSTTRIVNYDPSTVGIIACIPVVFGLVLGWFYVRRLRRYRTGTG